MGNSESLALSGVKRVSEDAGRLRAVYGGGDLGGNAGWWRGMEECCEEGTVGRQQYECLDDDPIASCFH